MANFGSVLDRQFIFIIGAPRSGTTWLQLMLGAHPQVCTTVELAVFDRYTGPWLRAWRTEASNIRDGRWYQGLPFLWSQDEFDGFVREFLVRVYDRVLDARPEATHILDKHPGYTPFVEDIVQLVPHPSFIHLVRDGRDVAASMMAARQDIGWFSTATVAESAKAWAKSVRAARKAGGLTDRYLEIRYEDLLTQGSTVLRQVFDFCGLPVTPVHVEAILESHQFSRLKAERTAPAKNALAPIGHYRTGKSGSWEKELTPRDRFMFDQIAGGLLTQLGYAKPGWWAENRWQRTWLPFQAAFDDLSRARPMFKRSIHGLFGSPKKDELAMPALGPRG